MAAHLFAQDQTKLQGVARAALKRAAELGDAHDRFAYGCALAEGRGGPVNRTQASVWLYRAQSEGIPGALAILDGIDAAADGPKAGRSSSGP